MLWHTRAGYSAARDLILPELQGVRLDGSVIQLPTVGVVVGGTAQLSKHFGWWKRLIEADFGTGVGLGIAIWPPPVVSSKQMKAIFPPSWHGLIGIVDEAASGWEPVLGSEAIGAGFAMIVTDRASPLTILGAPTDAGWDAFFEVAQPLFSA